MLNSVANKTRLKDIDFRGMRPFSPLQWQAFFNLLGGSNLSLEKLELCNNNVDDDDSLESMSSLKELGIPINHSIMTVGLPALSRLLCDKLSINTI